MRITSHRRRWILIAAVVLAAQMPANAQAMPEKSYKLVGIHFTGLSRFTQEEAAAVIALRLGEPITLQQIVVAQRQLSNSGVFETVAYRYTTHGDELTADFEVKESTAVLPCFFDNFVWFTDEEIDRTLRHRVALYAGLAPTSGTTLQEITEALSAMLRSNGIDGTIDKIASSPHLGAVPDRLLFQVKGVPMPVRTVSFPGSSGLSESQLTAASAEMIGQDFSITHWRDYASYGLVPLYKRNGYLNVRFGDPKGKTIETVAAGSPVEVAVTLPVEEGLQYSWEKADWSGNRELSAEQLSHLLGMKLKEVANQDKIDAGVVTIQKAYSKLGYIEAALQPEVKLNDAERLASYAFSLAEGTQYHMGQIHFDGIPLATSQELIKKWMLKSGDVFDASYLEDFMKNVAPRLLFELGVKNRKITARKQTDKEKALVDLYVEFR